MARKTESAVPRRDRAAERETRESLPAPSWGRRSTWLILALVWLALFLALASFSSNDWPSQSVAFHRQPAGNLLGNAGSLVAWWAYMSLGTGVWVMMAALAWMLSVAASGRVIAHPLVRLIGVGLMVICASSLQGWWLPRLSPIVGAECGLIPGWAFDSLALRFPPFATAFTLLSGLLLGAVVAMDEVVFALPGAILRSMSLFDPLWKFNARRLVGWLRPRPRAVAIPAGAGIGRPGTARLGSTAGRGAMPRTAVSVFPSPTASKLVRRKPLPLDDAIGKSDAIDDEETSAAIAEQREEDRLEALTAEESAAASDRGVGAGVDHDDDDASGTADDTDDADDDLEAQDDAESDTEDADDAESAADADSTPEAATRPVLTQEELRERISKLPVRMAGVKPAVARDEDIPREVNYDGYQFPQLELLEDPEGNFTESMEEFVRDQARVLTEALRTYQIDGEVTGIESGPVVTLYSVELAPGTRVARLETIAKDIARSLQAPNIRIIPNMVGRTAVGIEVPNRQKEKVRLKELMSGGHAQGMTLPMFLGKDSSGEPLVLDLARMPHMLIAGTTGSGKSVCMNTIIMGWLYTKRPDELKLVLVDPKMVEMSQFSDIPHLMCPVVTDTSKAAGILEWAVEKMEERYSLLKDAGVRDLRSYNELGEDELYARLNPQNDLERAKIPKKLPLMVFVIDELADLMMSNKEVEHSIVRIAQKARAVGLHLILATQRPQANVVTGLIKSNMPCRVSFKVASGMDSRIVLDQKGAELLLGQGDMLVLVPSTSELRRAQGTLVTDGESRGVAKFLKNVAAPSFERQLLAIRGPGAHDGGSGEGQGGDGGGGLDERDPLFDKAVEVMIESGRGSVSLLQRRLAIGYGRASRLVDQMGLAGILSDHKGSVAREVMITLEDWKRMQALEQAEAQGGEALEGAAAAEAAANFDDRMEREAARAAERSAERAEENAGVPDELPGEHLQ